MDPSELALACDDARDFAEALSRITRAFPPRINFFADLLSAASSAICLSLEQGSHAVDGGATREFLWMAREKIQSCFGLVEIAGNQGYISRETRNEFRVALDNLNGRVQASLRAEELPV